ncbi:MAG: GNAT family N-acetyltransferase [Bacteroidetes bacterium]|nr:GNAT family N-acetyltransferase [Bacteroidota bacterium]
MLTTDEHPAGYLSYSHNGEGAYFLHKLYVDTGYHQKGMGRYLLNEVFDKIPTIKTLRLTVNRKNYTAINFYFKMGFIIEEVKDFDIGNGYEMNDFVMLKKLYLLVFLTPPHFSSPPLHFVSLCYHGRQFIRAIISYYYVWRISRSRNWGCY